MGSAKKVSRKRRVRKNLNKELNQIKVNLEIISKLKKEL